MNAGPPFRRCRPDSGGNARAAGRGHLFEGFLKLRPICEVCGLDTSFADPADGPAFFTVQFMSLFAVAFAVWVELRFDPPVWVHFVTSLPVALIVALAPLRPLKGWLVASQFFYKAEEGRLAPPLPVPPAVSAVERTGRRRRRLLRIRPLRPSPERVLAAHACRR